MAAPAATTDAELDAILTAHVRARAGEMLRPPAGVLA